MPVSRCFALVYLRGRNLGIIQLQIPCSWSVWFLSACTAGRCRPLDSLRRRCGSRRSLCAFLPLSLRLSDRTGEGQRMPQRMPALDSARVCCRRLLSWITRGIDFDFPICKYKNLNTSHFMVLRVQAFVCYGFLLSPALCRGFPGWARESPAVLPDAVRISAQVLRLTPSAVLRSLH